MSGWIVNTRDKFHNLPGDTCLPSRSYPSPSYRQFLSTIRHANGRQISQTQPAVRSPGPETSMAIVTNSNSSLLVPTDRICGRPSGPRRVKVHYRPPCRRRAAVQREEQPEHCYGWDCLVIHLLLMTIPTRGPRPLSSTKREDGSGTEVSRKACSLPEAFSPNPVI